MLVRKRVRIIIDQESGSKNEVPKFYTEIELRVSVIIYTLKNV